jgi:hypothetical protein
MMLGGNEVDGLRATIVLLSLFLFFSLVINIWFINKKK